MNSADVTKMAEHALEPPQVRGPMLHTAEEFDNDQSRILGQFATQYCGNLCETCEEVSSLPWGPFLTAPVHGT